MEPEPAPQFNPLAAKAASMSLSSFGSGGPFGFDFFSKNWNNQNKKKRDSNSKVCVLNFITMAIMRWKLSLPRSYITCPIIFSQLNLVIVCVKGSIIGSIF